MLSKNGLQQLKAITSRFFRFGLVGLSGLIVDMSMLYLFHGLLLWKLSFSAVLAAEIAIVNNFLWNDRWTFRDIPRKQGQIYVFKRFLKFNVVCLIGVVLKVSLLNVFYTKFHINPYVANLLAILIVTFWNFWLNLKLSWQSKK